MDVYPPLPCPAPYLAWSWANNWLIPVPRPLFASRAYRPPGRRPNNWFTTDPTVSGLNNWSTYHDRPNNWLIPVSTQSSSSLFAIPPTLVNDRPAALPLTTP